MVEYGGNSTVQITSEQAFDLLQLPANRSQFFSGSYAKRDGTIRDFNGRQRVTKHLRGGELKYNASERGNIIYWDTTVEQGTTHPRTIRTSDLISLRIGKQDYMIVNPPTVEIQYDQS
tara:strand:- start:1937 stop:2290 length:354 start_codon:yes stop_codon:yes gene_type:complete